MIHINYLLHQGRVVPIVNTKGQGLQRGNAQAQVPQPRVAYQSAVNINARTHTGEYIQSNTHVQANTYVPMQESGQQYRMKPLDVEVVSSVRSSNPHAMRTSIPLRTIGNMSSDSNSNNSGMRKEGSVKGVYEAQERGSVLHASSSPVRGRQPYSTVGHTTSRSSSSTFRPPHNNSNSHSHVNVNTSNSAYQGDNQNNSNNNINKNSNNTNNDIYSNSNDSSNSSSSNYIGKDSTEKYSENMNNIQLRRICSNNKYRHPDSELLSDISSRGRDPGSADSEVQILNNSKKGLISSSSSVGRKKRQVRFLSQYL